MTVAEVATRLGVSKKAVDRMIRAGELRVVRASREQPVLPCARDCCRADGKEAPQALGYCVIAVQRCPWPGKTR
ncbi:helix-turn-helix domain-containing protein [Streptomyces sp. L7]